MTDTLHLPGRRRWLLAALGAGIAGTAVVAGCAGPELLSQNVSQRQLQELLARAFPYTRSYGGLMTLTLEQPLLQLLPEQNRLGTSLRLSLAEQIAGNQLGGGMDLDYGLRFDPAEGAVRLRDVRVNSLQLDQLPSAQQALLQRYGPRAASALLDDFVIYRLPRQQFDLAQKLGLGVQQLQVTQNGLRLDFGR